MVQLKLTQLLRAQIFLVALGMLLMGSSLVTPVHAECLPVNTDEFVASSALENDHFGSEIAISGDWAVIAAERDDDNGLDAGAVFMYYFNGNQWVEHSRLLGPGGDAEDYFGYSVAISGNTVVVGSWKDYNIGPPATLGSAYVYTYNGSSWDFNTLLTNPDGGSGEYGVAVAVEGSTILVGAPQAYSSWGGSRGVAFMYRNYGDGWDNSIKLQPSNGALVYKFGYQVAISGSNIAIGAYGDQNNGFGSGSVFIFNIDSDQEVQKIYASNSAAYEEFGRAMDLDGNTLIIGSRDYAGPVGGAVFVYEYDGNQWVEGATLRDIFPSSSHAFGYFRIAVSGDLILVNDGYNNEMFLFSRDGSDWVYEDELVQPDPAVGGMFGGGFAVEDGVIMIGDQRHMHDDLKIGAVYVFDAGCSDVSAVSEGPISSFLTLHQNTPNPFNPSTVIRFTLQQSTNVELAVYDVSGQLVKSLLSDSMDSGTHGVRWNGRNDQGRAVSSGIYFARITAGSHRQSVKLLLMK